MISAAHLSGGMPPLSSLRGLLAGIVMLICSTPVHADFTASGDSQITGQVGVGTLVPQAQMHIQDDATDTYALRVSSADGTVFFVVLPNGNAGIGLSAPKTHLDLNGTADNGDRALQLRVGNSSSTTLSRQIVFASTAGTYGHAIVTQHESDQAPNNAIEFFLWNSTGQPNAAANLEALSLFVPTASTASVHVDPFGTPDVELEVSNGACTGCGTIVRAAAVAPSSRDRKTDIAYLDEARRLAAVEAVKSLRHASFQYKRIVPPQPEKRNNAKKRGKAPTQKSGKKAKTPASDGPKEEPSGPLMRGLIYEDAPESVRGPGKTVVLDARVLNLEMALREAGKKIAALEAKISKMEKAKGWQSNGKR